MDTSESKDEIPESCDNNSINGDTDSHAEEMTLKFTLDDEDKLLDEIDDDSQVRNISSSLKNFFFREN